MALSSFGWQLDLTLQDSGAKKFYRTLTFNAADYAEATTRVGNYITALGLVSGMAVTGYRYGEKMLEDALTLPLGVEGENQAEIVFSIQGHPTKTARVTIPGAVDGVFLGTSGPSRDIVDTTDADLNSYVGQFTSGVFEVSDGELADNLLSGHRVHIKSRNG